MLATPMEKQPPFFSRPPSFNRHRLKSVFAAFCIVVFGYVVVAGVNLEHVWIRLFKLLYTMSIFCFPHYI